MCYCMRFVTKHKGADLIETSTFSCCIKTLNNAVIEDFILVSRNNNPYFVAVMTWLAMSLVVEWP